MGVQKFLYMLLLTYSWSFAFSTQRLVNSFLDYLIFASLSLLMNPFIGSSPPCIFHFVNLMLKGCYYCLKNFWWKKHCKETILDIFLCIRLLHLKFKCWLQTFTQGLKEWPSKLLLQVESLLFYEVAKQETKIWTYQCDCFRSVTNVLGKDHAQMFLLRIWS